MPTATKVLSILDAFKQMKYEFKFNECSHRIEMNGIPKNDADDSNIRVAMRDFKIINAKLIDDIVVTQAHKNKYHPVKLFIKKAIRKYDGKDHISELAECVPDTDKVFPMIFRKWLIGSIARVMETEQNPMLVLDGDQGMGKSEFARWLCPLQDYFVESAINPDDKDAYLRLASTWIWEVGELGATIRKADREALKDFISRRWVTARPSFGRHDLTLPAMASLIGTVNDECGLLSDPTGNRRFMICHLENIDWSYKHSIDKEQIWGEAYQAYLDGESWKLKPDEQKRMQVVNERYELDDAVEGLIKKYYKVDPSRIDRWIPTTKILEKLYGPSAAGNRSNTFTLGSSCRRLKLIRKRKIYHGQYVWGFTGLLPFRGK